MENFKTKIKIPPNANAILDVLNNNGYEGYVVGGCVRDSILNKKPNDWDICTDCTPEEMLNIFSKFKVIPTGLKYGTVTVIVNGENYEVTTYRIDRNYINGRHPQKVIFTNKLKEDLKRRDFTINAMAYNDKVGLVDYYGGLQDILNKKIRCVGNPLERFKEDYLRMLRGVRFATQLNYELDKNTFEGIKKLSKNIENISAERIREELNKILLSDIPSKGFKLLNTTGLLKYIMPELKLCVGFEQHNPHHDKDVFNHTLNVLDNVEKDLILRLAALFHDIGKPKTFTLDDEGIGHFYDHNIKSVEITKNIMKRLKYDKKSTEQVVILVKEHMSKYNNLSEKAIKRLINRVDKDNIYRLFKLQIADIGAAASKNNIIDILKLKSKVEDILNKKQPLTIKDLEVNGQDLMKLGIPEGKQIGIILEELLEIVLENPEVNKKQVLIKIVKNRIKHIGGKHIMKSTLIRDIYRNTNKYADETIKIEGWVRTLRGSKAFGFIEVNDGSFFKNLQVVFEEGLENFDEVSKLSISTAIRVEGKLVLTPNAKQPFEIKAAKVEIDGTSHKDYPLQKKRHSFEFLREIAHLRPRSNAFSAVFRVRSLAAYAIHKFFQERDFVYVHTPIITGSDAEGAGEMFKVTTLDLKNIPLDDKGNVNYNKDFFGKEAHLTVSGQLQGEAYALAFRNIYTFGPTFRAENSNTARHASEFWMIEPEIAFADLNDNMELAEDMLKYIINYVLENAPEEMEFFNSFVDKGLLDRLNNIVTSDFVKITYTEAIELLQKSGQKFEYPVEWGCDLQTEHERYITEKIFKKPVFVTNYPKDIKAFYMKLNEDGKTVAAMDLLVPGVGEIIGGSQREDRLEVLEEKIEAMGLDKEEYWWYLELRKYGSTRHAGFGLGFERAIMYLTGMTNIRDVISFPRTPRSAEF